MDRGTYGAASAGLTQLRKLDVVTNNLANVSTPGFKKQILAAETLPFENTLASAVQGSDPFAKGDHDRTPSVVNMKEVTDFSQGNIQATESPLDAALRNANDFFVIQTPEGVRYSKAGNFTLNQEGKLVTADGMSVQGDGGEITATGAGVRIHSDGSIEAGGTTVGKLQVVQFDDPGAVLLPGGGNRYMLAAGAPQPRPVEADVIPGSLELANVSSVGSIVDLITVSRAFEMYTKTAQSIDELNQQAISRYGSRR